MLLQLLEPKKEANIFFVLYIFFYLAPGSPPQVIVAKPLSSSKILVSWQEPKFPNGLILSYQLYVKEFNSTQQQRPPTLIRLLVEKGETSKLFAYNITHLRMIYLKFFI